MSNYVEIGVWEPTNWPLIAGIAGVLVIISIAFVFYVRRH